MDTVVVSTYFSVLDLEQHHEHKSVRSYQRCLGLSHQTPPANFTYLYFKDLLEFFF